MENKQAVAVAVGVGAVGTALAYLGYSIANGNADVENLADAQTNSWWANLWTNSNVEKDDVTSEVSGEDVQLKEAIKEEEKNVKIEKKEAAWPTFWKGEYEKSKTDEDNKNEASADDYN